MTTKTVLSILSGLAITGGAGFLVYRNRKPTTNEHLFLSSTVKQLAAGQTLAKETIREAYDIARRGFPLAASKLERAL